MGHTTVIMHMSSILLSFNEPNGMHGEPWLLWHATFAFLNIITQTRDRYQLSVSGIEVQHCSLKWISDVWFIAGLSVRCCCFYIGAEVGLDNSWLQPLPSKESLAQICIC